MKAPVMLHAAELQTVLLSTRPADPYLQRVTWRAVALSLLVAVTVAPFARDPLPRHDLFLPVYQTALVVCCAVTAALLFNRATIGNSSRLLLLAGGFVFSGTMAVFHALSFPGLFAPGGLLGAGEQTTAWLYFLWHLGFAVAVLGYAWMPLAAVNTKPPDQGSAGRIATTIAIAVAVAVVLLGATTIGHDLLPRIMAADSDLPSKYAVAALVVLVSLGAFVALLLGRGQTALHLWLVMVLAAWTCDLALSSLLNAGRFSVGWYAGRLYGLLSMATLLFVFVAQEARLTRTLVEMFVDAAAKKAALEVSSGRLAHAEAAASQALDELRRLASGRLGAREEERKRLARDLHDEMGQSLMALKLELDWLNLHTDDPAARARIESMLEIIDAAVQGLRRILAELRPPLLDDLGFAAGLTSMVNDLCSRSSLHSTLKLQPADLKLDEPYASTMFRIVQEALTNVVRHGNAGRVWIDIATDGAQLLATVRDDGCGFDPDGPAEVGSTGLAGIRERVHLLAGRLRVDSGRGHGTVIEVSLPVAVTALGGMQASARD